LSPVHDFGNDYVKHYRERGILAYRSGNLYLALAAFNLAIQLDPNCSDTYIDRGIVLYRMGDRERAFADVAEAERIDQSNRNNSLSNTSAP
jgi:Flp pilus assembly protein TadD